MLFKLLSQSAEPCVEFLPFDIPFFSHGSDHHMFHFSCYFFHLVTHTHTRARARTACPHVGVCQIIQPVFFIFRSARRAQNSTFFTFNCDQAMHFFLKRLSIVIQAAHKHAHKYIFMQRLIIYILLLTQLIPYHFVQVIHILLI